MSVLSPNSSNGSHSAPKPIKTPPRPTKSELAQRESEARAQAERDKVGCPTGCGCSGFAAALLVWTPALLVARAGGVGIAAIGITIFVSLFVGALLLAVAHLTLSGVSEENKKAHLKPHLLFLATYLITFLALLVITFFVSRAHS